MKFRRTSRSRSVAMAVALGEVGCAMTTPATRSPEQVVAPVVASSVDPASVTASCDPDHVWDPSAKACRLYPGGGYGWAGCSLAKEPPNGEKCLTGTHWEACDCKCDKPATTYDPTTHTCR